MKVSSDLLTLHGPPKLHPGTLLCISRMHNEANILPDFLDSHRRLAAISFLVVDDRSTDGTAEILAAQPDVTVFHPVVGSTYSTHKEEWVNSLLDRYGTGQWCLVLDADEHLVYRNMETVSLRRLLDDMERSGANALPAVMVEMYADKTIGEHVCQGGPLKDTFCFFDDLRSYRYTIHRKYGIQIVGGMRTRLFFSRPPTTYRPINLRRFRPRRNFLRRYVNRLRARLARYCSPYGDVRPALTRPNQYKTPIVFWKRGMLWSAHNLSFGQAGRRLYPEMAVLLHYKITRGIAGIEYIAARGQHIQGGAAYRQLLLADCAYVNPMCEITRKFADSRSVFG